MIANLGVGSNKKVKYHEKVRRLGSYVNLLQKSEKNDLKIHMLIDVANYSYVN